MLRVVIDKRLRGPSEADQVAFGVCEMGNHEIRPWVLLRIELARRTEAFGRPESGFNVRYTEPS